RWRRPWLGHLMRAELEIGLSLAARGRPHRRQEWISQRALPTGGEPACDATPKDHPLRAAAWRVKRALSPQRAPCLRHAPVVERQPIPRPQTKADQDRKSVV